MIMTDPRSFCCSFITIWANLLINFLQTNRPSPKSKIQNLLRRIAIHLDFQTSSAATIPPTNNKIDELKGEENTHLIFQCRRQFQTSPKNGLFLNNMSSSFGDTNHSHPFSRRASSRGDQNPQWGKCWVSDMHKFSFWKKTLATQVDEVYLQCIIYIHMGVSQNRDTPKWMVYNQKPY